MDLLEINIDLIVKRVAENIRDNEVRNAFISLINNVLNKRERSFAKRGENAFDLLAMYRSALEPYTRMFDVLRYKDDYKLGIIPNINHYSNIRQIDENDSFIRDVIIIKVAQLLNTKIKELTTPPNEQDTNIFSGLAWEDKTEICELIHALASSKRIIKDGKPITKKALREVFEMLFKTDLSNIDKLLNAKAQSAKQSCDNENFLNELCKINEDHFKRIILKTPKK